MGVREQHLTEQPAPAAPGSPPSAVAAKTPSVEDLASGVLRGDRAAVGRAISLVESSSPRHRDRAEALLALLTPRSGDATRVGITGVPGVGKSTFIERLGCNLCDAGRRVAVLAVDPSSGVTGGSILGDKTRMSGLSARTDAFVRPSPSGGTLGGVARRTRESMLVCEAAGFDVVLVETVGVGQSETIAAEMTDFFLVLTLPGAGDELQGIKRGLLELADMIAVNKADGDNIPAARRAQAEHAAALRCLSRGDDSWSPPVLLCSARTGEGIHEVWGVIEKRVAQMRAGNALLQRRQRQALAWTRRLVDEALRAALAECPAVRAVRAGIETAVAEGRMTPSAAASALIEAFLQRQSGGAARRRTEG